MQIFRVGDKIAFTANGVQGIVTRVFGPANQINSVTGNDVIEWSEIVGSHLAGGCVHDASELTMVDAVVRIDSIDFTDGAFVNVLPNAIGSPIGRAAVVGPPEFDGTVAVRFPRSGKVWFIPLYSVRPPT